MKRILCLIDQLGPGGAERQMVGLVSMLHDNGYHVVLCYHEPHNFFIDKLENEGVEFVYLRNNGNFVQKLLAFRKVVTMINPNVVISYLQTSCMIACIARLTGCKYKLIVSERNTNRENTLRDRLRFHLFRVADYVVPNSFSQKEFILNHYRFLSRKTHTIVNYVDLGQFSFTQRNKGCSIVVAATIWPPKNTLGLIKGVNILKNKGVRFHIKWFGRVPEQLSYTQQCEELISKYQLSDYIELLDKTHCITEEYAKANFFCLPSFYEGTPNAICEAMATGLPILCSDVCDNGRYVKNCENGYLFNPNDPDDIAQALWNAVCMDDLSYKKMSYLNRKKAEQYFSETVFIDSYIRLIEQ